MNTNITTQAQVRMAFWKQSEFRQEYRKGKRQNAYSTDIRCAWCEFLDSIARDGQITRALAERVTL